MTRFEDEIGTFAEGTAGRDSVEKLNPSNRKQYGQQ